MTQTPKMQEMQAHIASGPGFIAALDQSGGSTPTALRLYGIEGDSYGNESEMFALIHAMRCRIMTAPCFTGDRVIGAILFEKTMAGEADGQPVPQLLWERGIVPFLKIDQGLEAENAGVQLMKELDRLDALCEHARAMGVFGTKMRSVIHSADGAGITAIVAQQCAIAKRILRYGLTPIIEPEVSLTSDNRAACDQLLRAALLARLDDFAAAGQSVLLKLSLPIEDNFYAPLMAHPAVLRVFALSGGFSRVDACATLARNRDMVASFSRALLENLRYDMDEHSFNATLGKAIEDIYQASLVG